MLAIMYILRVLSWLFVPVMLFGSWLNATQPGGTLWLWPTELILAIVSMRNYFKLGQMIREMKQHDG